MRLWLVPCHTSSAFLVKGVQDAQLKSLDYKFAQFSHNNTVPEIETVKT